MPLFSIDWLPAVCPSFGRAAGVAGDHVDARERQIELLGGDLRERGQDALPELDLAGEHGGVAVGVDAQPGIEHAVGLQAAGQPRRLPAPSSDVRSEDERRARCRRAPAVKSRRVR